MCLFDGLAMEDMIGEVREKKKKNQSWGVHKGEEEEKKLGVLFSF